MPVSRPVVLTALMIVAASAVHSQSVNPAGDGAQPPASLFAAVPAAPAPMTPNVPAESVPLTPMSNSTPPSGAPQPWTFSLPKPPAADVNGASAGPNDGIDLSALRYFASQNDLSRVAAEIRLIRSKHPDWQPPDDLFGGSQGSALEAPLWKLFAQRDYAGVRAGIAQIQQSTPDWRPSADLLAKLTLAEASDNLVKASDDAQWGTVIEIAAANKMLLTCAYVDALWRTAEALVRTDDEPRAVEAYRYILTNCAKPTERLATVQKASQLLVSPDDLEGLLQLGRRLPDGRSEFDSVRLDILRKKIGDAAAGKAGPTPSPSEIETVAAHARTAKDQNDQQLLGWYAYANKDYVQAESWFGMALQAAPSPKAAEGLVLTLRAADKIPEAQKLAVQYASLDHLNRKLMVEVLSANLDNANATPLSTDDLASLAKAIDAEQSADAAQSFGWHVYKANDLDGAQSWFRKSIGWQANESAAIGLVVTARRSKHMSEYAELVAKYRDAYPKIAQFDALMRASSPRSASAASGASRSVGAADGGWDRNADAIAKTLQAGNYDLTLAMLEERRQERRPEPFGLTVVRGWAMFHKGDWEGARQVFAELAAKGHAKEADEGLSTIQAAEYPRFPFR
jgi:tetratricopeptide (TPR) repeat protein